jgi:hypothetical protein
LFARFVQRVIAFVVSYTSVSHRLRGDKIWVSGIFYGGRLLRPDLGRTVRKMGVVVASESRKSKRVGDRRCDLRMEVSGSWPDSGLVEAVSLPCKSFAIEDRKTRPSTFTCEGRAATMSDKALAEAFPPSECGKGFLFDPCPIVFPHTA